MRHIFLPLISIFFITSCKAQIAPLYRADPDLPEGTYYKDLDNDLDKFVGTWLWQNGNNEFTLVIQKKEQVSDPNGSQFNDMLVGEYSYVENGTEIMNYLSRLDDTSIVGYQHYVDLLKIMHKNHRPKCEACEIDERRVQMFFHDPERAYLPVQIVLRYIIDNGVEKLEAYLEIRDSWVEPFEDAPKQIRIPHGDYVFIKQ